MFMQDILQSAFDPEAFRRQAHALVDQLADHLARAQSGEGERVIAYRDPDAQLAYWQADFEKPPAEDPLPLLEEVLQGSVHLHHPRYMGHQVAPPLPLTALTGLLTGLLNNGMALYEMGQVSTAMERVVTDWLARKIGFTAEASGFLTRAVRWLRSRPCWRPGRPKPPATCGSMARPTGWRCWFPNRRTTAWTGPCG
jgi:L-2,4-diaminobutyrate decarboxylase